jgi:hypothetical protein
MSDFSKNLDALWKKLEEERLAVNASGLAEIDRLAAAESVLQKEHLAITSERADWNAEKCEIARTQSFPSHQVTLDVGGERFTTTLATLTRYPKVRTFVWWSSRVLLLAAHTTLTSSTKR